MFPARREKKETKQENQANTPKIKSSKSNITYAQATKGNYIETTDAHAGNIGKQPTDKLESMMIQLLIKMDAMLNILTMLINKIK